MAKIHIQCLVCREEDYLGGAQVKEDSYQCPSCGNKMNDYQWTLCRSIFYTACCTEKKRGPAVEVRLFSQEVVYDDP